MPYIIFWIVTTDAKTTEVPTTFSTLTATQASAESTEPVDPVFQTPISTVSRATTRKEPG